MKRTGRILSLVVILIMIATAFCFATSQAPADDEVRTIAATGGFNLISTYPEDGAKGAATENMSIKLYFDTKLSEEVLGNKNADAIQFFGPDGKKLPTRVLYSTEGEGVVLAIVDTDENGKTIKGKSNSEYKVKISGNFVDDAGNTLGADQTITFRTLNETTNNTVSMIMMFVMTGGIMVVTMKAAKKEVAEEYKRQMEAAKVNPYKEAKKTGKSVEEIVEKDQRDKAKKAEKAAKKAAKEAAAAAEYEFDDYYEEESDNYKVKGPRPIAAAGGKYISGRKALAEAREARKAQEAKWAEAAKKKGKKKKK